MAAGDTFPGRRVTATYQIHELLPGDYMRKPLTVDGRTFEAWWLCTPNGLIGRLSMPEDGEKDHHRVDVHGDHTISVRPQPTVDSMNSILVEGWNGEARVKWHGYIEHGVWRACE